MKKRKNMTTKVCLLLLLFAALVMIAMPFHVWAQELDTDNDGISDIEEILCQPWPNEALGQQCLGADLGIADYYVMLVNEDPSSVPPIPDNPFEFITEHYGVVPMNLHVINLEFPPASQQIAEHQNAVILFVNPDTSDGDLGASQIAYPAYGVDYGFGISGSVFPNRIMEDVVNACNLKPNCICVTSAGNILEGVQAIYDYYLKNVLSHEAFHMLGRVVPPDRKLDYHYPQEGYIMDHHMYYKEYRKTDTVQWFITDTWAGADMPRFK